MFMVLNINFRSYSADFDGDEMNVHLPQDEGHDYAMVIKYIVFILYLFFITTFRNNILFLYVVNE